MCSVPTSSSYRSAVKRSLMVKNLSSFIWSLSAYACTRTRYRRPTFHQLKQFFALSRNFVYSKLKRRWNGIVYSVTWFQPAYRDVSTAGVAIHLQSWTSPSSHSHLAVASVVVTSSALATNIQLTITQVNCQKTIQKIRVGSKGGISQCPPPTSNTPTPL